MVNYSRSPTEISLILNEDDSFVITQEQLLNYAVNVDGTNLQIKNITSSRGRLITNADQSWTFIPEEEFAGVFDLNFIVTDGKSSVTQRVLIDVNNLLQMPTDYKIFTDQFEDEAVVMTDIDNDILSLPPNELIQNADGTVTYLTAKDYTNRSFMQRIIGVPIQDE